MRGRERAHHAATPPPAPVSAALLHALAGAPLELPSGLVATGPAAGDPLADEDLQLTLHVCYELHYQGFEDVDESWEWHPSLLGSRQATERRFEAALRRLVPLPAPVAPGDVPHALAALVEADDGPQLSKYLAGSATTEQFREFVTHRSICHLREADPHRFAVPRLAGLAKAALCDWPSTTRWRSRTNDCVPGEHGILIEAEDEGAQPAGPSSARSTTCTGVARG
jgi:hypothetical protein